MLSGAPAALRRPCGHLLEPEPTTPALFADLDAPIDRMSRDAEARTAGIAVINGVGFDVVPSDCVAALAAEAAGAPVRELEIYIATARFQPTQGTVRSALEAARHGGLSWVGGALREEPLGAE